MKTKLFFVLALISVSIISVRAQTAPVPEAKTIIVPGLKNEVIVRRDSRSIPYISAQNEADLYFTQGYITASDRLWQMDLYRRVPSGRTAELFGSMTLEQDKRWRRFGFKQIVEESYRTLPTDLKEALDSYARGVNAYISSLTKDTLPVEFKLLQYSPEPWKPTDSLLIGKILADALSTSWYEDATRAKFSDLPQEKFDQLFLSKTPFDVLVVGKDLESDSKVETKRTSVFDKDALLRESSAAIALRRKSLERIGFFQEFNAASNNWVVSGKRTLDGKAMLANDPHLDATAPSIWYLSHLTLPGGSVSGVTFPGAAGIILGHNEYIAWGATNLGPDVQDLYIEEFNDKKQHRTDNGWVDSVIRTEEIKVRKSPMGTESEVVKFEVVETDDGVIIQDNGDKKVALKWTARYPENNEFEAFYRLNKAKNWDEFKASVKTYRGATQNFVYADVRGNIGFHNGGAIPVRSSGNGRVPYDGTKPEGKWKSFIPFEELPQSFNPQEGFIVTANQRLAGDSYKHYLGDSWADPYRARRIHDLIANNSKMTIRDSMDIQRDVFSISYANFAREVVKLGAASDETLTALRGFDGKLSSDSHAALLLTEIRRAFLKKILASNLGEEKAAAYRWSMQNSFIDWLIREKPANWMTKELGDYKTVLMEADKTARANLVKKFGADLSGATYGKNANFTFRHPLAAAPLIGSIFVTPSFGVYGGFSTPNVGAAVSMRHVTSPGNWDETRHGITLGQSGDPKSPFFKDQFESWQTGSTPVFPFSKSAVEKATLSITKFKGK